MQFTEAKKQLRCLVLGEGEYCTPGLALIFSFVFSLIFPCSFLSWLDCLGTALDNGMSLKVVRAT